MIKCIKHRIMNIFSFKESVGRLDYTLTMITLSLILIIPILLQVYVFENSLSFFNTLMEFYVYYVALYIPLVFANASRRLNDIKMDFLWMLVLFIPGINLIFKLYLIFAPSKNKQ